MMSRPAAVWLGGLAPALALAAAALFVAAPRFLGARRTLPRFNAKLRI